MHRFVLLLVLQAAGFKELALAQGPVSPRYAITRGAVAATLQDAGLLINESSIQIPVQMTSPVQAPSLEVSFVATSSATSLRLRIHCRIVVQCIPFFAQVELPDPVEALAARKLLQGRPEESTPTAKRLSLQPGQQARFLLEDEHMRISIPVILIDSGDVGTEVRVASLDHKQVFKGTVADAGTVRGTLP